LPTICASYYGDNLILTPRLDTTQVFLVLHLSIYNSYDEFFQCATHDICQNLLIAAYCNTIDVNDQVQTIAEQYHGWYRFRYRVPYCMQGYYGLLFLTQLRQYRQ
jgi:hypothetical protein